jgi:TPR repeat protein
MPMGLCSLFAASQSELVLSIYELGQCFLRGWGVAKDKKTALQYFTLAANLGDPDAQSELGFCYSTGRGCKKDLKQAAKYYRMAAKQGQITYGMQWM